MTDPALLPVGVRDVLPVEAAELRVLGQTLADAFGIFGYREVMTPLVELADVLGRADDQAAGRAYRLFDDEGRVLVLRPDLTIPIARLVATRMADHPDPVRIAYNARAVRPPTSGKIEGAEQRQAGIELVGAAAADADAEVVAALARALAAAGVPDARIAVGSVALVSAVLDEADASEGARAALWDALHARSVVEWRRAAADLGCTGPLGAIVSDLPALRGGPDVLERVAGAAPAAAPECARMQEMLALAVRHGIPVPMVDLGVVRDWSYYSGVVIEAYAAGVAVPVAVGGRYDGLGACFGRPRPAVGVAVALDLLHHAVGRAAEREGAGVVLVGGADDLIEEATRLRAYGVAVVGVPRDCPDPDAVALADGRRHVVRREGNGWMVRDVISGTRSELGDLGAGPWT